ncbi:MAG: hypothetical protein QOI93_5371, partial [Rhodospirillaceae bacterium]|nr:hypothetical protein [Rhodospirillaceae bacterium]
MRSRNSGRVGSREKERRTSAARHAIARLDVAMLYEFIDI